jgi:aryl-alcohol dehydrogenase-like predicted oxidoreductase
MARFPGPFAFVAMETRRIGSLEVSVVGLGCNNFGMRIGAEESARVVHAALDAGVTFFDTADIYGATESEVFLGRALAGRRDSVVVATKFGMRIDAKRQGAKPDYVRRAVEDSLQRLGTDRIDLYQLHQPDPTVPIADTLGALGELVRTGKVREIGCSNFSAAQLRESWSIVSPGAARFASVQNEFSLVNREPEREVLSECQRLGMTFLPYFPLASGLLTGKYRRGVAAPAGTRLSQDWAATRFATDDKVATAEALEAFARSSHHTLLELAISWLASHRVVASVIAGATSPEQVRQNVAAAGWRLTESDRAEIDRIAPVK